VIALVYLCAVNSFVERTSEKYEEWDQNTTTSSDFNAEI
jgi:hypothetical protein